MTEKKNDGGPAFPHETYGNMPTPGAGMSKREWYAGQALAGLLVMGPSEEHFLHSNGPKAAAQWAFAFADAMLEVGGR